MIKKWATVISWRDNITLVEHETKTSSCSNALYSSCIGCSLREPESTRSHTLLVFSQTPLVKGQKVELGISERNLIGFAILVYFLPLIGFFMVAGIFQILFSADIATMCSGILGGIGGFLVASAYSSRLIEREAWQLITILRVVDHR